MSIRHAIGTGRQAWRLEYWAALAVFAVVSGMAILASLFYLRAAQEDARAGATALASELRARCESEIASIVYLSSGLNAYLVVNADHLDQAAIDAMLAQLYASSRHVRNFGVAEGFVLRHIYPVQGNESAIGLDYRTLPKQLPAVQEAIRRRTAVLSPRIQLVQGGEGVIYRTPIFIRGAYWGLLSTVIDIDDLFQSVFSGLAVSPDLLAIREAADSRSLLWGNPTVPDHPEAIRLKTGYGWEIDVLPVTGRNTNVVVASLDGAGFLLGSLMAAGLFSLLRNRRELRASSALQAAILGAADLSIIAGSPEGVITLFNRAAERMLGYTAAEMVGRQSPGLFHDAAEVAARAEVLSRELGRPIEPGFEAFVAKARTGATDENQWTYIRKDGSRFPVMLSVTAIRDGGGAITGFLGIASDITERQQKDRAIVSALHEKETLLKEVYHRVKNNLQVITSLFNLQSRTLPSGPAREALREGAERVRAMALVHEKLYQSSTLASISIEDYVCALCQDLQQASGAAERGIRFALSIEPIQVGLETAVPLGLLMNELIANSLKHGFPEGRAGEIRVSVRRSTGDTGVLEVSDSGIGYSDTALAGKTPSLGMRLIDTLSRQLDGRLTLENRDGACTRLEFRIHESSLPAGMGA